MCQVQGGPRGQARRPPVTRTPALIRLLTDQNFNGDITNGLAVRYPDLDLVRVQDIGLSEADDPTILASAADDDRIVLTHDKRTMPPFANRRVADGETMPGVFVVDDWASVGTVLDDLTVIVEGSEHAEWAGVVEYLPFKRPGR